MKPEVAADTAHSAIVTDHPFSPKEGEEWGLCKHVYHNQGISASLDRTCNLSGATHAEGPFYEPTATYPKESHL